MILSLYMLGVDVCVSVQFIGEYFEFGMKSGTSIIGNLKKLGQT